MTRFNVLSYVQLAQLANPTGVGRVLDCLLRHLQTSADFSVRLLVSEKDLHATAGRLLPPWEAAQYVTFRWDRRLQQARWLACHFPPAERYWSQCNVVWCPAESYVPTKRARLLVTVHDIVYPDYFAIHGRRLSPVQLLKWRYLFRVLNSSVDALHVVSQFTADSIISRFPDMAPRIRIVPNPVHEQFFLPPTLCIDEVMRRHALRRGEFLLIPGGLCYRKNAPLIINAWPLIREKIPDLQLVVFGQSEPGWKEKLEAIDSSVKVLGYRADNEIRVLYGAALAVWFPSRYEGFGIPVLEAMACGTPVVASKTTAVPEVAGQAAILMQPHDACGHAEAILELCSKASLHNDYARRGLQRAAEFRADRVATKFEEMVRSIA